MTDQTINEQMMALFSDYRELQSEIFALEAMADEKKAALKQAAVALGGKIAVKGYGSASVIPASTSHSYDTKRIDELMARALVDGDMHTATAIAQARKETTRSESFRVVLEK
jgi:hypothetical protein